MSVNANINSKKSVLFICLGNICRSPIGEAVFIHLCKQRGIEKDWVIDSAALAGYHVGGSPDSRAMKVLKSKGIDYKHTVRQIIEEDFSRFHYIFGKDTENIRRLNQMAPKNFTGKVELLGKYDPNGENNSIIRDPYYDDDDKGFFKCYEQCVRSCNAFLDKFYQENQE